MIPLSVLDLAPVPEGATPAIALAQSADLARQVERLGFRRYWLAEHHNMPGIASAATAVVIAHVAQATSTIRVGAGGIMLPNHAPLAIAEQFGTLAALFPGRIDLGLGRAPGTDQVTARALRRGHTDNVDSFPEDVLELQSYFHPTVSGQTVQAVTAAGADVPLWLLGSSLYSAQLAAALGLPFAFASHFAPAQLHAALRVYRSSFQPSAAAARPYAMAAITIIAADTEAEAARLFTSQQQSFLNLRRGRPGLLPPPVDDMASRWTEDEAAGVGEAFREAIVGTPDIVAEKLAAFRERTGVDEVMVAAAIYDHAARVRSYELVATANRLAPA